MIYNVVFGFDGKGQGWSESHAIKVATEDPNVVMVSARRVAQKRVTFLGREYSIQRIRVATYSDDAGTTRRKGVAPLLETFTNPVQTLAQAAEPASVALLARGSTNLQNAPAKYAANVNQTFCGAPPDPAVDSGGDVDPAKSNLGVNFAQWTQELILNGYGWLISDTKAILEINTITQNANGTVSFTTDAAAAGVLVEGQTYEVRVSRVNNGVSPLNGELIVKYTGPGTWKSRTVVAYALAQSGGQMRVYNPISPFAAYTNIVMQLRVGQHQRGLPFAHTRGRARRRIRG